MTFLAEIVVSLMEWLLSKAGMEVYDWIKAYRDKQLIIEKAKADAEAMNNAKTTEEKDAALSHTIDNTFH